MRFTFLQSLLWLLLPALLAGAAAPAFGEEKQPAAPAASPGALKVEKAPVPATLDEAHLRLEVLFSKEDLAKIDAMNSQADMIQFHRGFGTSLRNDWGLWAGGPLAKSLNKPGFTHPDDMSSLILETYWCKRHHKDFRLQERAARCAAWWRAAASPPESARDPEDGSTVNWTLSFNAPGPTVPRHIHVGKSSKSGRWLAFEFDKGVYVPDSDLMKQIKASDGVDPFIPKK